MKTKMFSLLVLVFITMTTVTAQTEKKETFKVAGNCGMCETRIEKATKSVDGVLSAEWDKETKMIEVSFEPAEANIKTIHKAIAGVGHDTELVKADDETYAKLPACCKYERIAYESSETSGSNGSHEHSMH